MTVLALAYSGTVSTGAVRKVPTSVLPQTLPTMYQGLQSPFQALRPTYLSSLPASAAIPTFEVVLHLSITHTGTGP